MTLKQLTYFKNIAELQHYTKVAQMSCVSQSSVSHAIQALENELNVKLFSMQGNHVELTKYGQILLPYVQETLKVLETGVATLTNSINSDKGIATMACPPALTRFASDIIVRYVSETNRSDIHLQVSQDATYDQLQEQLLSGKVELIFSTAVNDSRIVSTYIGEHPLTLLVPDGHPLAEYDKIDLRVLDGEDFIAFSPGCQLRGLIDQTFHDLNIRPCIKAETTQELTMNGMVAANHGVAIIPYPLNGAPYRTKIVPISTNLPRRRIYLMRNQECHLSPSTEQLYNFIAQNGEVFSQFYENIISQKNEYL